ncbi:MAG: hypothetical protein R3B13_16865 [Polyangiaceae bacterium]
MMIGMVLAAMACVATSTARFPEEGDRLPDADPAKRRAGILCRMRRPCHEPPEAGDLRAPVSFDEKLLGSIETT